MTGQDGNRIQAQMDQDVQIYTPCCYIELPTNYAILCLHSELNEVTVLPKFVLLQTLNPTNYHRDQSLTENRRRCL